MLRNDKTLLDTEKDLKTNNMDKNIDLTKVLFRNYRNLASVCVGWLFIVVSFGSLQGIVSSINHEDGLGFFSMACFYSGAAICPFAAILFRRWKTKPVLCALTLAQVPMVLSYAIPKLYTVLPAAFIGGISQSVAFSLTGAYLVWVSKNISSAKNDETSKHLSLVFGIYYMAVSIAPTIGGLCSTFIISNDMGEKIPKNINETEELRVNQTRENHTYMCGQHFCPSTHEEILQLEIEDLVRYFLLGFYSLCMVVATFVFLIGMEESAAKVDSKWLYSMSRILRSTIDVVKEKRFLLAAPLVFYNGFQWAFATGDIMKAFGGCVFGAENIGNFIATYHFATCVSSVFSGFIEPKTGRYLLLLLACTMHISTCVVMMVWSPYLTYLSYVICGLWGLGSGTFLSQSHALMGEMFAKEVDSAMAVYLMFRSFGHTLGFGYAHFLCMYIKVYVTGGICLLAVGLISVLYCIDCRKTDSRDITSVLA